MKTLLAGAALLVAGTLPAQTAYVANQVLVKLDSYRASSFKGSSLGSSGLDQLGRSLGISGVSPIGNPQKTHTFLLSFALPVDVTAVCEKYRHTVNVLYAEPNYLAAHGGQFSTGGATPDDTAYATQWGLHNDGTMTGIGNVAAGADAAMEEAWDIETGDPDMVIAVPDTGLKLDHPDIAGRLWQNPNEIANGIDDDGNGLVDDLHGWDFVNNDNQPTDDNGHGTNVAGIIGAIPNNHFLFAGANWNSRIMPLKVLNNTGSGSYAAMAASIYYAVDNGAKIISMSIGGTAAATTISDALAYAMDHDVLFLACTMNVNNDTPYYPSAYSLDFPNVIAVGATNPDDTRTAPFFWSAASGSNYGSHVCLVAPGNFIYGLSYTSNTYAGSYWGGTSQATPLVAAIASLVWAHNPALTAVQVRQILEDTANDQVGNPSEDTPGFDVYMGYGRVNAAAALQSPLAVAQYPILPKLSVLNPVSGRAVVIYASTGGDFDFSVCDMSGKQVSRGCAHFETGSNLIPCDLPNGSYVLTLAGASYKKIFKLIKR